MPASACLSLLKGPLMLCGPPRSCSQGTLDTDLLNGILVPPAA